MPNTPSRSLKVKRPAARSFRARLTPAAQTAYDSLTAGLAVVVSPSGSYVRLKTEATGPTVCYMHTRTTGFMVTFVRGILPEYEEDNEGNRGKLVDRGAPARLRKNVRVGGHGTAAIDAVDAHRIAEARALIEFMHAKLTAAKPEAVHA